MAAERYYHPSEDISLKPMQLNPHSSTVSVPSAYSENNNYYYNTAYDPLPHGTLQTQQSIALETADQNVKKWVRILKLLSRVAAAILSAATLVPLLMTIVKFEQTKDVYFLVDGQERSAWAHDSITWYTFMYAGVSAISFILNVLVLAAYARGIKHANKASDVSSWWTWIILASHVIIWCVSAGLYRYGKEPVDGKFRDLWGWTCSTQAEALQAVLTSVDFEKYCGVQTASFYIGLTNIGTGLLSLTILVLAVIRRNTKKKMKRYQQGDLEPLRQ